VLAQWNNRPDTLSRFQAHHAVLLFLLNAACLAEKQQIPILYSSVWTGRDTNPWDERANQCTTKTTTGKLERTCMIMKHIDSLVFPVKIYMLKETRDLSKANQKDIEIHMILTNMSGHSYTGSNHMDWRNRPLLLQDNYLYMQ